MANPPSPTGRLLDDDMPPPHGIPGGQRPRPTVVPQAAVPLPPPPRVAPARLAAPKQAAPAVPLQPAQRACYEALGLALQEGHVFAAVTGPEGCGKTTVLEAVLADRHDRALRCIRISDADKVPARLAAQIEQVAYAEAGKPENLERHVVLAIDDAHTASNDLLRCLARLASMREPGRRVPQILLVGRPELWNRLATEEYAPLARRIAIRAVLPKLQDEQDPWASLEQEVSQTMSQLRADSEMLPAVAADAKLRPLFDRTPGDTLPAAIDEAGLPFDPETIAPPTDFALFPDPPPRAEPPPRASRRRLALPLGCLLVAVAAFTFVLSYFDWPGVFDDLPWAESKPATSFAFAPQANPPVLPQTPAWAQPTQRMGQAAAPRPSSAATPSAPPAPVFPGTVSPATVSPLPRPAVPPATASAPPAVAPAAPPAATPSSLAAVAPPRPAPPPPVAVAVTPPPAAEPASSAPKPAEPAPQPAAVAAITPPPHVEPPKPARPEPAKPAEIAAKPAEAPRPEAPKPAAPSQAAPSQAAPSPAAEPPAVVAALTVPPVPSTRSSRTATSAVVKPAPLPPAIVGLLLRRGDEQLAIGDVSAARLLFERAAESGNAQGAFRLARTYDANFLPAADAAALANRSEARIWYGRAASLGDREAAARLKDLNEER